MDEIIDVRMAGAQARVTTDVHHPLLHPLRENLVGVCQQPGTDLQR